MTNTETIHAGRTGIELESCLIETRDWEVMECIYQRSDGESKHKNTGTQSCDFSRNMIKLLLLVQ